MRSFAPQSFATDPPGSPRGWGVVGAAAIGLAVGLSPLPFYTIGMFAPELARTFHWSFASLMAGIAIQSITVMLISPLAGFVTDKFGARRIAMLSLFLFGLSFMAFAFIGPSLMLFYVHWAVMSVLGVGTLGLTWARVVSGWFDRNRGLALGFATAGTGITGFLIKPLCAWLITAYGWRTAYAVLGLLPIVIGIPVVWLLFVERRSTAVLTASGDPLEEPGMAFRDALRDRKFWIIMIAFLLIAFSLTAPTPNMENILRTFQLDLATIAGITSSFGLAVIFGRIAGGWLIDRVWAPAGACGILSLPAIACWVLARPTITPHEALGSMIALGVAAGIEFDLLAYLVARYFGQRNYGAIYGSVYTAVALGGGVGPVVFGRAFDLTGSYAQILPYAAVILLVGSALLLLLGPYRSFTPEAS